MEAWALVADPVPVGVMLGTLALVMLAAAWHKLRTPDEFAGALLAYRLLPEGGVRPAARVLPVVELVVAVGILVPATRAPALWSLATLLLLYAGAMAINLGRGRRDIDCGCGGKAHLLSWGLIARNMVLSATALLTCRPTVARGLEWTDGLTLVLGALGFYALYVMIDELLRHAGSVGRLRAEGRGRA